MKYKVVQATSVPVLEASIESLQKEGWVLQGGISAYRDGWSIYYLQAMVKL